MTDATTSRPEHPLRDADGHPRLDAGIHWWIPASRGRGADVQSNSSWADNGDDLMGSDPCGRIPKGANMSKDLIPKATLAGSRRTFLYRGAVLLGGTLLGGPALAAGQGCRPTESEILGPFYRFGAPFRSRLAGPEEPGDRLVLTGTVLSSDCRTPLTGH